MSSAQTIVSNYCFNKSTKYIFNKAQLLNVTQLITYTSIKYSFKLIHYQKPKSIMQYYKFNTRKINILGFRTIYKPKSKKMQNHVIYKAAKMIMSLPNDLKNKPIGLFNKQLKAYL